MKYKWESDNGILKCPKDTTAAERLERTQCEDWENKYCQASNVKDAEAEMNSERQVWVEQNYNQGKKIEDVRYGEREEV